MNMHFGIEKIGKRRDNKRIRGSIESFLNGIRKEKRIKETYPAPLHHR